MCLSAAQHIVASHSCLIIPPSRSYAEFEPTFKRLLREAEDRAEAAQTAAPRSVGPAAAAAAASGKSATEGDEDDDEDEDTVTSGAGASEKEVRVCSEGRFSRGCMRMWLTAR